MSEPILVTRALTKKYGGAAAVEGVDLYIEKGQIYGLVGRNVPRYEQKTLPII